MVEPVTVYNFSCDPLEQYEANGILVHNCSYGSGPESIRAQIKNPPRGQWKNQQLFKSRDEMPLAKMRQTVRSFLELGVKAVELTGGGEPAAYPHFDALLEALAGTGLEVAIVSNGTLLTDDRVAALCALPFVWARISIDAGTCEDYTAIRHCPASHWPKAWTAVELLATGKTHPEARVGVGYVVDTQNWRGLYEGCKRAKEHGADNVRLSMSFTPDGTHRWEDVLVSVREQADRAKAELEDATFQVNDLTGERARNVVDGAQTYPYCAWKDVGCVLGADQNVYACCSWAYNPMGLMGSIRDRSFAEMWRGDGWAWRQAHDPRRDCRIHCLYWARNMEAFRLMGDPQYAAAVAADPAPPHGNFI